MTEARKRLSSKSKWDSLAGVLSDPGAKPVLAAIVGATLLLKDGPSPVTSNLIFGSFVASCC